jgi:hypothetical protein
VFVVGRPFQHSLKFAVKARSLPKSGAPYDTDLHRSKKSKKRVTKAEKCVTYKNDLAYYMARR